MSGFLVFFLIFMVAMVLTGLSSGRMAGLRGGRGPRGQVGDGYLNAFGPPQLAPPEPRAWDGGYDNYQPYGQPVDEPLGEAARAAVDADITKFGDELRDLDLDVVGIELTEESQADYTAALDSYENAKQALSQARFASDVTAITHILQEGRFAMASVKARAHGRPLPERRPPCFFDPAHGPSVANITWSPDGGTAREVPACALDMARVRSGANPHIRMVGAPMGGGMVPYWQDRQFAPWARGYYQGYDYDPVVRSMTSGMIMFGGLSLLMGLLDD